MPSIHTKVDFFETADGIELKSQLVNMEASDKYKTVGSYSPKTELYEDNIIPFVQKHMNYLKTHPQLNPYQYLANLQISTRIR